VHEASVPSALKSNRGLIPGGGLYEWQRIGNSKQPYCFEVNEGEVLAFAGIWDRWNNARGNAVETCSILTTTAQHCNHSGPRPYAVILDLDSYDLWLDPGVGNVGFRFGTIETLQCSDDAVLSRK
jgi:putative SOS response-associated peptidase YedK